MSKIKHKPYLKDTTLPWHYHPVINAAVILQGILELKSKDGSQKIYQKDDALGTKDVHLIVFYAGVEAMPTTVLTDPKTNP